MRAWHLFTGWYEATRARADDPQDELPFGFVELSETFAKIAQERGFFVTGFDSAFFHRMRPVEQRLVLYLSKMFVSQELHRRHESELYSALPIEAVRLTKRRQTLREACMGLSTRATRTRGVLPRQGGPHRRFSWPDVPPAAKGRAGLAGAVSDAESATGDVAFAGRRHRRGDRDPDSIPMWVRAVRGLGEHAVRYALGRSAVRATPAGSGLGRRGDSEAGCVAYDQAHGNSRGAWNPHHPAHRRDAPVGSYPVGREAVAASVYFR